MTSCPPEVIRKTEEAIGLKKIGSPPVFDRFLNFIFGKTAYALSGAAAVVLIAFMLIYQVIDFTPTEPPVYYSEAEIEEARMQIEKTFAMVVPVVQNAQDNVRNDIIMSQIFPPLQTGLQKTKQLFRSE